MNYNTIHVDALYPVVRDYCDTPPPIVDLGTDGYILPKEWEVQIKRAVLHLGESAVLSLALKEHAKDFGYVDCQTTQTKVKEQIFQAACTLAVKQGLIDGVIAQYIAQNGLHATQGVVLDVQEPKSSLSL